MVCFSPLVAYRSAEIGKTGKRGITFSRSASLGLPPIKLPCGQCVGCKLERSRQWAMRCLHEKRLHRENCFLTLTYDNQHLPPGGTLVKRDLQLFMKRLRVSLLPKRVRFYACGEYGEINSRPHYHVLLFGHDFPEKKFWSQNRRGDKYFESDELRSVWDMGNNIIGEITFDSAAYVARYILKKIPFKDAADFYHVVDEYGEVFTRIPEFTVMSRRPGIGSGWYDKYGGETYAHDSVVVNGHEVRPPRYYDLKYELVDPNRFVVLKGNRRRRARLFAMDNTPDRLRVKEVLAIKKLKLLERKV